MCCCRYDRLLTAVRVSGRGPGVPPGMCVVGVSVVGEEVMKGVTTEYQRGQVSVYPPFLPPLLSLPPPLPTSSVPPPSPFSPVSCLFSLSTLPSTSPHSAPSLRAVPWYAGWDTSHSRPSASSWSRSSGHMEWQPTSSMTARNWTLLKTYKWGPSIKQICIQVAHRI